MMASWVVSSGMRLSYVIAMKSHLGLLAIFRLIQRPSNIKGIVTTEDEAFKRIKQRTPGLLFWSDQLA